MEKEGQPNSITRRKRLAVVAICATTLAGFVVWAWSDTANFRWTVSRVSPFVYDVYDFGAVSADTDLGPSFSGDDASTASETQIEGMLAKWFPGYSFAVDTDQGALPDRSHVVFEHENLTHGRVQQFAEDSSGIRRKAVDLFDLSQQVRSLTIHRADELPATDTDPIEYLQFAKDGKGLTCRYFAVIYGAAAIAEGYTTRIIGLSKSGIHAEHAVVEVYVPQFKKWILVDPDFNIAYKNGDTWLNARDLHEAWQTLKVKMASTEIEQASELSEADRLSRRDRLSTLCGVHMVVLGDAGAKLRATNLIGGSSTGMNLEYFEYVMFRTRNSFLSADYPPGHLTRSMQYVLQSEQYTGLPDVCADGYIPESIERDLYWVPGASAIHLQGLDDQHDLSLQVVLATYTPNFKAFEIAIDEEPWRNRSTNRLEWKLHVGSNNLRVRSINLADRRGVSCTMRIRVTKTPTSKK